MRASSLRRTYAMLRPLPTSPRGGGGVVGYVCADAMVEAARVAAAPAAAARKPWRVMSASPSLVPDCGLNSAIRREKVPGDPSTLSWCARRKVFVDCGGPPLRDPLDGFSLIPAEELRGIAGKYAGGSAGSLPSFG